MGVDPISMATVALIVKTAMEGAIAGAAVGGITGGGKGALKGAAIGGLTGAVTGGLGSQLSAAPDLTQAVTTQAQNAAASGAPQAQVASVAGQAAVDQVSAATPQVGIGAPVANSLEQATKGGVILQGLGKVADSGLIESAAVGGAGLLASKALAGGAPSAPRQPSGQASSASAALAAERERQRQRGAGRASTILSGPLGVSRPANVGIKTLLGQ